MSYLGKEIKKLGFGLMRLPQKDGKIDIEQTKVMVDKFLEAGFTYFDTAWAYAGSEDAIRQALVERYSGEKFQQMVTEKIGWGSGSKDLKIPNVLKVYYEEIEKPNEDIVVMETNIDDCCGEILGYTQELLLKNGALDVFFTPIYMFL